MIEKPRPVLLEFKTFRMRGHEEASGLNMFRINGFMGCERSCRKLPQFFKENAILTDAFDTKLRSDKKKKLMRV
jgi:2-oxoisovalerate dehydrogenase E1 component